MTVKQKIDHKKLMEIIISKCGTSYGATMGRGDIDNYQGGKIYSRYLPMYNDNCHDKGNAYWGIGERMRVDYTADLNYVKYYRGEM